MKMLELFKCKHMLVALSLSLMALTLVASAQRLSEEHRFVRQKIVYLNQEADELTTSLKDQRVRFAREYLIARVRRVLHNYDARLSSEEQRNIIEAIMAASDEFKLNPALITAIIETESHFNIRARSYPGARGLMQVMPHTGREIAQKLGISWQGAKTLYQPAENIRIGTYYFAKMIKQYGEVQKALIAYNEGPARVNYRLRRGYKLSLRYQRKVMQAFEKHNRIGPLFA